MVKRGLGRGAAVPAAFLKREEQAGRLPPTAELSAIRVGGYWAHPVIP